MNKWHIPDLNTLEKKLNTDISDGLSAREASVRLEKQKKRSGGNISSLFVPEKNGTYKALFCFVCSPLTILLLLISLLSAIFGRPILGSLVFAVTITAAIYGGIVNMRAERRLDSMREYASPMVRVKRGGRVFYTDGRNIVVGDVIILGKGDLMPCDARIVQCDSLIVDEIVARKDATGLFRRRILKQKNAKYSDNDRVAAPDALNMLYAGSAIINGDAVALVVSVGEDAYLSGYVRDGALVGKDVETEAIKDLKPVIGKISFICACALTLLSLVGFITLSGKADYISYFMMMIASCFFITGEFLTFTGKEVFSSYIARLSRTVSAKRKKDNAAAVRNVKAFDRLTDITDLVLFGTAGIYEGGFKVGEAFASDKTLKTLELSDPDGERLISYVHTYIKAIKDSGQKDELVSGGYVDALNAYVKASGFDIGGAALATKSLYYANDIRSGFSFACAETESSIYCVSLTFDEDILNLCKYIRINDEVIELDDANIANLKRFMEKTSAEKAKNLFCVTEHDGKKIFEGVITLYQSIDKELSHVVKDMSAFGINTTVILASESEENLRLINSDEFKGIFKGNVALASEFRNSERKIVDGLGSYIAYVGFTSEEYAELINTMRGRGSRIASYGISGEYNEMMAKTDVVVSCDVIRYSSEKHRDAIYERLPAEGRDTNVRASQQTRLLSRIIVRRAHSGGGGVYSLFKTVRMSRGAYLSVSHSILLFALLSVNLLTVCSMSVITGNVLLDPLQAVSLSSVFAILSATVFSDSEHKLSEISAKTEYRSYPKRILSSNIHALISRASVAFVTAITVKILDALGVFGENPAYTLPVYICLLITMCIEVLIISNKHTKKGEGRSYTWLKVIIAYGVLLSICAISTQQPFSEEFFKNGFGSYEYLIIPGYMIVYSIALLVSYIIGKKQEAV